MLKNMQKLFSKCFGKIVLMTAAALFIACGDDASRSGPEGGESSAVEESSSSSDTASSSSTDVLSSSGNGDSGSGAGMTSSNSTGSSATAKEDSVKISYTLKPFDGPLSNPHKGFTVPTGGA